MTDYLPLLDVAGHAFYAEEIIATLSPFLSEARASRIAEVVRHRIGGVVPVLEGLYDRGNASAVLRSAEGLGYQQVHIIDSCQNFKEANRVTQGAEKWLEVTLWDNTRDCLAALKSQGYRLLVTHMDGARDLGEISFSTPTAMVFGNEKEGVSPAAIAQADERVMLPMCGFSQSFNISVAAALCLYHAREERRRALGGTGDLSPEAQRQLLANYYMNAVQHAEAILLESRVAPRPASG